MDEKYYAHLSEDGRKQTVLAHLLCTALLCAQFAAKFGEKALGYWAGLLHDIGKFAKAFQKRLFDSGKKVDHSTAGAWESKAYLPISLCIMGHHSGLPDLGGRTDKGKPTYFGRMNKAKSGRLEPYDAWKQEVELPEAPKLEPKTALELDFLTRMLYSCLTDADFLDTEAFMSNGQVERGGGEAISVLSDKLDRYTEGWFPPSNELNTQRAAAEKVLADLKANEAQYKQVIAEQDAAMERQQAEIVRLSRELAAKNGDTTATLGGYIWPCSSRYVTSPLGARYTGIAGASTNHAGIDIGRVGYTTQAVAAKAGTVIISAYNKYRGNYVVVSHGSGNTTTYQHLSSRSVNVGDYVAQGQVVGITGTTGVSSGPHLHFEITENGKIVNPLNYLTNYIKGW